jgi:hypothetical protein
MVVPAQISEDEALIRARLPTANDNYKHPTITTRSFDVPSVLSQFDDARPRTSNKFGLYLVTIFCVLAVLAFRSGF